MKGLDDAQMKKLAADADEAKKNGKSVKEVFAKTAKENNMASGSVRNLYYASVKRAETDPFYAEKIFAGVKPDVAKIIEFDKAEARLIMKKILSAATDGKSIRRAISELSPDPKTALRYQNKYRSMLSRDRAAVEETIAEIKREKGRCFDPYRRPSEDELILRLKREINSLYDKISDDLRKENTILKAKIASLEKENTRLKYEKSGNSITKEYFENVATTDKRRRIEFHK